jgi:hypothetical protein
MNDHDLLVVVAANVQHIKSDLAEMKLNLHKEMADLKARVTTIENTQLRASSRWDGIKALWGLLLSVPAGVLGWIISGHWGHN